MNDEVIPTGTLVVYLVLGSEDYNVGVVTDWYPGDFAAMYAIKDIENNTTHIRTEDMLSVCAYSYNNL